MGLRLNTNVTSMAARRSFGNSTNEESALEEKMSSGTGIRRAADNAAGLAISEKLKARIKGLGQAERNANDGISLVQTAEGGLNESSNILIRLRELAVQAASDTLSDSERGFMNMEYQQLKHEVDRISSSTEFNGKKLINGEGSEFLCQIGYNNEDNVDRILYSASRQNSGTKALGIGDIDVSTKSGAQNSLGRIDSAIQNISGQRADLGALQNRLTSTVNNLQSSSENLSVANSRIRDTEMASVAAQKTKVGILTSVGASVLSQANSQGSAALKLLG